MDYEALLTFARNLDRSEFVDDELKPYAYIDAPLPIGYGQTISQPSLVLEMTRQLAPEKTSRVLEIGTGSGYQTAILAAFSGEVYTVERIPELQEAAKSRLEKMGFENIHYKLGDGSIGWSEHAPYDRIIVTAAAAELPLELQDQLKPCGRMVIPVGSIGMQQLLLVIKDQNGQIFSETIEYVTFVELVGKYGWN